MSKQKLKEGTKGLARLDTKTLQRRKKMNENKDFKSFKRWCKLKGLKPGNAKSLQLYMKKKKDKGE